MIMQVRVTLYPAADYAPNEDDSARTCTCLMVVTL